jgi:hypothetical protein
MNSENLLVIDYAKFRSRSHDAVIRVYDAAGNVIETHGARGRVQISGNAKKCLRLRGQSANLKRALLCNVQGFNDCSGGNSRLSHLSGAGGGKFLIARWGAQLDAQIRNIRWEKSRRPARALRDGCSRLGAGAPFSPVTVALRRPKLSALWSVLEIQTQRQPRFLRLSAMISQYRFTLGHKCLRDYSKPFAVRLCSVQAARSISASPQ